MLLKKKISTKILPEAYTWHFAREFTHIRPLFKKHRNLKRSFKISHNLLQKTVSLPIFIKMDDNKISNIQKALIKALK